MCRRCTSGLVGVRHGARPIRDRRHEYTLSRYGLDPDRVQEAFGDYVQMVTGLNE
ncbi:hypothetical protein GCM10027447_30490 [Glycomyces halotolerans]